MGRRRKGKRTRADRPRRPRGWDLSSVGLMALAVLVSAMILGAFVKVGRVVASQFSREGGSDPSAEASGAAVVVDRADEAASGDDDSLHSHRH